MAHVTSIGKEQVDTEPFSFATLESPEPELQSAYLRIEYAKSHFQREQISNWEINQLVELETPAGQVTIIADGVPFALGEVVTVDGSLCVKVTELLPSIVEPTD